jgi:hypothetical protein
MTSAPRLCAHLGEVADVNALHPSWHGYADEYVSVYSRFTPVRTSLKKAICYRKGLPTTGKGCRLSFVIVPSLCAFLVKRDEEASKSYYAEIVLSYG